MKTLLKIEELAQLLLSIYLFSRLPFAWWAYPLFFFVPDVSLLLLLGHSSFDRVLRFGLLDTAVNNGTALGPIQQRA